MLTCHKNYTNINTVSKQQTIQPRYGITRVLILFSFVVKENASIFSFSVDIATACRAVFCSFNQKNGSENNYWKEKFTTCTIP